MDMQGEAEGLDREGREGGRASTAHRRPNTQPFHFCSPPAATALRFTHISPASLAAALKLRAVCQAATARLLQGTRLLLTACSRVGCKSRDACCRTLRRTICP